MGLSAGLFQVVAPCLFLAGSPDSLGQRQGLAADSSQLRTIAFDSQSGFSTPVAALIACRGTWADTLARLSRRLRPELPGFPQPPGTVPLDFRDSIVVLVANGRDGYNEWVRIDSLVRHEHGFAIHARRHSYSGCPRPRIVTHHIHAVALAARRAPIALMARDTVTKC